jgi:hypothetical protein
MNIHVNREDLCAAVEWISSGEITGADCQAYVNRITGAIHWAGEGVDETLPDDIDDGSRFVEVPSRHDLELGRELVLRFVAENIPDLYERVYQYFRKKEAYSHFKAELERAGQLESWYEYEQRAMHEALREWSEENGFLLEPWPKLACQA